MNQSARSETAVFRLKCKCGTNLEVPEHLANQKIRCTTCQKVLTVPPPPKKAGSDSTPDLKNPLLVKGTRPCPSCGKGYAPAAKVCVDCGIDLDSGALLYASLDADADPASPVAGKGKEPAGFLPRLLRMLGLGKKK